MPDAFRPRPAKDDAGEIVPVADDIGENADEQGLLHQPGNDVVISTPRPEERRQHHVDDDQRRGDEGDFARQQTETAVDILGKDFKEMVNYAGAAHVSALPHQEKRAVSQDQAG